MPQYEFAGGGKAAIWYSGANGSASVLYTGGSGFEAWLYYQMMKKREVGMRGEQ